MKTNKLYVKEVSFGTMLTYWGVFKGNDLLHYTLSYKDALTMMEELNDEPTN